MNQNYQSTSNPPEDEEWVSLYNLSEVLQSKLDHVKYNQRDLMFPDTGIYRRELYGKYINFLTAGAKYRQRAFIAANRVGKTRLAAYEMMLHLTGDYPAWWKGKKFTNPINAWAAGISNESTKQIIQQELFGDIDQGDIGTGMIPRDKIIDVIGKPGITASIGIGLVKHKSGGVSKIELKSYEQGWKKFQGTKRQVIWLDEEPVDDPKIYTECLTRTVDQFNPGIILCTFTPLSGYSKVVEDFLPNNTFPDDGIDPENPYKYVIQVTWDECPHLSEEDKKELIASYPEHERDARTKGLPSLGSGAIFPYPEESITCKPFPIPEYWPRAYGFDVGWNMTAAVWVALDPDSGIYYLYSEHYGKHQLPAVHASAIKARGDWISGVIDTGSKQVSPTDGRCLWEQYIAEGLRIRECEKSKEAAIMKVGQMLLAGQLKVFGTMFNWLKEYRKFRRDDKGDIVKKDDHEMDATLYVMLACPRILEEPPELYNDGKNMQDLFTRDEYTGY